uniref:Uncharacterized protein n=1 Tax=Trichogramma kaykai TaxID=54128 RepID=A0ABD2WS64_9HYME
MYQTARRNTSTHCECSQKVSVAFQYISNAQQQQETKYNVCTVNSCQESKMKHRTQEDKIKLHSGSQYRPSKHLGEKVRPEGFAAVPSLQVPRQIIPQPADVVESGHSGDESQRRFHASLHPSSELKSENRKGPHRLPCGTTLVLNRGQDRSPRGPTTH